MQFTWSMLLSVTLAPLAGAGDVQLSLAVRSDALAPLPGAAVTVEQAGSVSTLPCDANGQCDPVAIDPGAALTFSLEQQDDGPHPTLGLRHRLASGHFDAGKQQVTLQCLQPTLTPVVFVPGAEIRPGPVHDRWVLTIPETSADEQAQVSVGLLLGREQVRDYFDYHGVHAAPDADRAIVVRSIAQALPVDGVWLALSHVAAFGGELPPVETWLVTREAPASVALLATPRELRNDVLYVHLAGKLDAGDNVIVVGSKGRASHLPRVIAAASRRAPTPGGERAACVPEAPRPAPDWKPDPATDAHTGELLRTRDAELVSSQVRTSTARIGGVRFVSDESSWKEHVEFYGHATPGVIYGGRPASDADGRLAFEWNATETATRAVDGSKCVSCYRHEAHLVQTWKVLRDRLVPGPKGSFTIRDESVPRQVATISVESAGPSIVSCKTL